MALKPRPQNRPPRPIIESPSLLVCHEKHGEVYFVVQNDEDIFRVALSIVRGRLRSGDWYCEPEGKPSKPDFTAEDIEKLPASLRKEAIRTLTGYQQALQSWEQDNESYTLIGRAVETQDGRAAWRVLRDYSDGEYQRVSIERLSTVYYEDEKE